MAEINKIVEARTWRCFDCEYVYVSPIEFGLTSNLSGELSQQCPKCLSKNLIGSQQFYLPLTDEIKNNGIRERVR